MDSEQQALKRLAETRKQVDFSYGAHNIIYSGKGIEVERFKSAIGEAIRLGDKIESEEAMSEEIKLGWYRYKDSLMLFKVIAKREDIEDAYIGHFFKGDADYYTAKWIKGNFEYLGTELPPKGRWVDFDPAKVTCDMFPIKARMRDKWDDEWTEKRLFGYTVDNDSFPFLSDVGDDYKFCQIWEEE